MQTGATANEIAVKQGTVYFQTRNSKWIEVMDELGLEHSFTDQHFIVNPNMSKLERIMYGLSTE